MPRWTSFDVPYPLIAEIVKAVYEAGAMAFVNNIDTRVRAELLKGASVDLPASCAIDGEG